MASKPSQSWHVVDAKRGGKNWAQLCAQLDRLLDDLYQCCEVESSEQHVTAVVHILRDGLQDFNDLAIQLAAMSRPRAPISWQVRPHRMGSKSPRNLLPVPESKDADGIPRGTPGHQQLSHLHNHWQHQGHADHLLVVKKPPAGAARASHHIPKLTPQADVSAPGALSLEAKAAAQAAITGSTSQHGKAGSGHTGGSSAAPAAPSQTRDGWRRAVTEGGKASTNPVLQSGSTASQNASARQDEAVLHSLPHAHSQPGAARHAGGSSSGSQGSHKSDTETASGTQAPVARTAAAGSAPVQVKQPLKGPAATPLATQALQRRSSMPAPSSSERATPDSTCSAASLGRWASIVAGQRAKADTQALPLHTRVTAGQALTETTGGRGSGAGLQAAFSMPPALQLPAHEDGPPSKSTDADTAPLSSSHTAPTRSRYTSSNGGGSRSPAGTQAGTGGGGSGVGGGGSGGPAGSLHVHGTGGTGAQSVATVGDESSGATGGEAGTSRAHAAQTAGPSASKVAESWGTPSKSRNRDRLWGGSKALDDEERLEALLQRSATKDARSKQLRQAHLAAVVQKAGDEARKVAEVAFINRHLEEEKKLCLQQKLEDGEARRREILEEKMSRSKAASLEQAAERRRAAEDARQDELVQKAKKKEAAQLARATKLDQERREQAAAREAAREAQRQVAREQALAAQKEATERNARIEERLKEAAQRRAARLDTITQRAALGAIAGATLDTLMPTLDTGSPAAGLLARPGTASGSWVTSPPRSPQATALRAATRRTPSATGVQSRGSGASLSSPTAASSASHTGAAGSLQPSRLSLNGVAGAEGSGVTPTSPTQLLTGNGSVTGARDVRNRLKGMRRRAVKMLARLEADCFEPEAPPSCRILLATPQGQALLHRWRSLVPGAGAVTPGAQVPGAGAVTPGAQVPPGAGAVTPGAQVPPGAGAVTPGAQVPPGAGAAAPQPDTKQRQATVPPECCCTDNSMSAQREGVAGEGERRGGGNETSDQGRLTTSSSADSCSSGVPGSTASSGGTQAGEPSSDTAAGRSAGIARQATGMAQHESTQGAPAGVGCGQGRQEHRAEGSGATKRGKRAGGQKQATQQSDGATDRSNPAAASAQDQPQPQQQDQQLQPEQRQEQPRQQLQKELHTGELNSQLSAERLDDSMGEDGRAADAGVNDTQPCELLLRPRTSIQHAPVCSMHLAVAAAVADMSNAQLRPLCLAVAGPSGLLTWLCQAVGDKCGARLPVWDPGAAAAQLLVDLLQEPANVQYVLAGGHAVGLVRGVMRALDRANSSEAALDTFDPTLDTGRTRSTELACLEHVMWVLTQVVQLCDSGQPPPALLTHTTDSKPRPASSDTPSPRWQRQPEQSGQQLLGSVQQEAGAGRDRMDSQRQQQDLHADTQAARLVRMREHMVGFMTANGIVHRLSELFMLCDQPQLWRADSAVAEASVGRMVAPASRTSLSGSGAVAVAAQGSSTSAEQPSTLDIRPTLTLDTAARQSSQPAASGDQPCVQSTQAAIGDDQLAMKSDLPQPLCDVADQPGVSGTVTEALQAVPLVKVKPALNRQQLRPVVASDPGHVGSPTGGGGVQLPASISPLPPVPASVVQGLHLLQALTTRPPATATDSSVAPQYTLTQDKRWLPTTENASSLSLAFQETSMAGLPMLLTAVLLHAAPSCTPAEAQHEALPPNFPETALAVVRCLNNIARLDLPAFQSGLASNSLCVGVSHLLGFLLSYATNAWPQHLTDSVVQLAFSMVQPQQGQHAEEPQPLTAAAGIGRKLLQDGAATPEKGAAKAPGVVIGLTQSSVAHPQDGRPGSHCVQGVQETDWPVQGVHSGDLPSSNGVHVQVVTASGTQQGQQGSVASGGCLQGEGVTVEVAMKGREAHEEAATVALLNEVLVLVGYFTLLDPKNQGVLTWGRPPDCVLHRLAAVPRAYLSHPALSQVLLGTLVSACYDNSRLRDLVEAWLPPGSLTYPAHTEHTEHRNPRPGATISCGLQPTAREKEERQHNSHRVSERMKGDTEAATQGLPAAYQLTQRLPSDLMSKMVQAFRDL